MNTLNNKRKKESQEKIEKVFLQLIQTKQVDHITVSDICKIAKLNRSTFYSSYIDIYDLIEKIKIRMADEFASMYISDFNNLEHNNSHDNWLKMFKHIKENQIFYKTYFKLESSTFITPIQQFDTALAQKYYNNKNIPYHIEFFRAGLNAIIKKWLDNNCLETPEEMLEVLVTEYVK